LDLPPPLLEVGPNPESMQNIQNSIHDHMIIYVYAETLTLCTLEITFGYSFTFTTVTINLAMANKIINITYTMRAAYIAARRIIDY